MVYLKTKNSLINMNNASLDIVEDTVGNVTIFAYVSGGKIEVFNGANLTVMRRIFNDIVDQINAQSLYEGIRIIDISDLATKY